ncbi:hypothetical protein LCGC14_2941080 [marine sediment metagenome]|uniref:Uncharacterized protein n=1 Tax=marine sediment metagenome TaxID=412755 RepID=A0A0F9A936_9ZZZZ
MDQQGRPATWQEWADLLKEQIKIQEMSLELLKAQFTVTITHISKPAEVK